MKKVKISKSLVITCREVIREAIEIRKWDPRTINRDEGACRLSPTWSNILEGANGQRRE